MPIFKIEKIKALQIPVKEDGFSDEAKLRDFFAENLEEILGVRFLEKEYLTTDGRIDTLGIDENNSPVIIEYKWKENEEILAQGLFYFNWLMKNKKHFDLLAYKKLGGKIEVNWEQPRVILIAQGFSHHVLGAVEQEKNIELKTYTYYNPNLLQIEDVYTPSGVKTIQRRKKAGKEKEYNLDYHFKITSPKMRKAANLLRSKIIALPGITENFGISGIYYRTTSKSFVRLEFRATWIQLLLRDSQYKGDDKKLIEDITSHKWGYRGRIRFKPDSDIEYVFNLVKQSYESTL
ncbi:MAG: endonuclease NucS [Candidatus Omnitrophica bacterium]|nr:endonuclease NucS [Candidatus Omnitrophota bacterium]